MAGDGRAENIIIFVEHSEPLSESAWELNTGKLPTVRFIYRRSARVPVLETRSLSLSLSVMMEEKRDVARVCAATCPT